MIKALVGMLKGLFVMLKAFVDMLKGPVAMLKAFVDMLKGLFVEIFVITLKSTILLFKYQTY